MDDQKYLSDAKYKQFIVAIDKSLKNFEYSSEWADLISCLGKLNKVFFNAHVFGFQILSL